MSKKFKRPTKDEQLAAIGLKVDKTNGHYTCLQQEVYTKSPMSAPLCKAVTPDDEAFARVPKPKSSDWLANFEERGQSFRQFNRCIRNIPNPRTKTIYILPLTFFEKQVPEQVIQQLATFAGHFFGLPVKAMKAKSFAQKVPHREHDGSTQVNAGSILTELKSLLPRDAFCLGAITLCDLYPKDEWNFVFGLASTHDQVGVYSLARYMPEVEEEQGAAASTSDTSAQTDYSVLLLRACRLMCHEIGHMFGLLHCIYYHCLMNGSNHFAESDAKPMHLCPVCFRKLQLSCDFDVIERYQNILRFCQENGLPSQAEWYQARLHKIS